MRLRLPQRVRLGVAATVIAAAAIVSVAPAAQAVDEGATMVIDQVSPTVLTAGETFTIAGTIRNTGSSPIENAEIDLQLSLTPGPVTDRHLLSAWQSEQAIDDWGWTALAINLEADIEPGGSTPFSLSIPSSHLPLSKQSTSGAFPCRVDLRTSRGAIAVQRTFIVFQAADGFDPLSISTMLPILASPQDSATAQGTTGAASPASIERAARIVASGADSPVDWLVDPALIQGGANDTATKDLLDRLAALGEQRDIYRLPWGDVDVGALAAAGGTRAEQLYTYATRASDRTFASHKLTNQGLIVWPALGRIDAATVLLINSRRAPDAVALASSPIESTPSLNGTATPRIAVDGPGGRVTGLVSDDTLTALLTQSDGSDAINRQRIVAELAALASGSSAKSKAVFVLPNRAWTAHFGQLESNLRAISALSWVSTVRTSTLLTEQESGTQTQAGQSTTSGGALAPSLVTRLGDALQDAETYASVTRSPEATLAPLGQQLLFPLSISMRDQPSGREANALAAIDAVRAVADSISVKQGSDINLLAQSGQMPVSVANSGTQPVTVTVKLESPDRRLLVPESKRLAVRPDTEERTMLRIEAVASGDVTLNVLALNDAGQTVAEPSSVTVRVRADWEDWGTLGAGILFAGLLVVGLFRSRKKKREDREKATT